ncbi:hypothetical protein DPMN_131943 [Dreissena polymorpha]|uniref:Uncharacterized protein n=1 Tax=Dreissena polymorpha TaxID=45954 RepID=A0A9D4JDA2_DREPO|nr:hypothetical protein DPMN_131943 [Dreissena polymorpha]
MTDIAAESPSKVGNFVIRYSTDVQYIEDVACETIKNYFNNIDNNQLAQYFVDPDKAFIPRAFSNIETLEKEPADQDHVKALFDRSTKNPLNMAKRSGNVPGSSFQPDVIVSTSHHRPGPDGSPALVPPSAQGFGASNLSETGELFAPVRTLTFSDIDQSSQIEDSYVNESRLVSTPDKKDKNSGHYDYSNLLDRPYDPVGSLRRNNGNMNGQPEDSSDSENADERFGSQSPEFRQLEGEADNEPLTNTGPFNPSMHGLSKEFMDQFVGKTSHQGYGDVFSPLGSNVFHVAERRMQSATPPLHSPAPNSPYAKYAKGSPGSKSPRSPKYQQSPRGQGQGRSDYDADEIQFVNSPTRIVHPFNREVIGHGANTAKSYSHGYLGNASTLHTAKGRSFSHQDVNQDYSFQPIEKQPTSSAPRNIPKNLNEYFDHHDREQEAKAAMYLNNYQFETAYEDQYGDDLDIESRQGDGSVSDGDTGASRGTFNHATNPGNAHDGSISPEPGQKGVPRTQVSVRLPQPTYDTLSGDISNGNHFLSYPTSPPPPPDVALTVHEINDNDADTHENGAAGNKVMDLLQNQSSVDSGEHYERDSNPNTADVDSSSAHVTSVKTALHMSQKSKDTGQPQMGPISSNSYLELPTQQHQSLDNFQVPSKLPVPQANNSRSQGGIATVGMKPHDTVPSQVNLSQPFVSTAPTSGGINSQAGVSSRLLQETASHRSKTTQKYVSTQPQVVPKTSTTSVNGSKPSQEFKKPVDVCPKAVISSVHVPSQGAKKTLVNETANKFKVSDRAKPKSTSMETLPQRQQKGSVNNANQSKAVEHGANGTHFRSSTSSSNQTDRSKNQGQPKATDNSAGKFCCVGLKQFKCQILI